MSNFRAFGMLPLRATNARLASSSQALLTIPPSQSNRRTNPMLCSRHALSLAAVLTLAPIASAQTVEQVAIQPPKPAAPGTTPAAQQPAPVYVPTSLKLDADVPRTPDGHPDFQGAVWASNYFPVFEATPMAAKLVVSEAEGKQMVDM